MGDGWVGKKEKEKNPALFDNYDQGMPIMR